MAVTVFFLLLFVHPSPVAGALLPCLCPWHFCSGRMGGCLCGLSSPPMGLAAAMGRLRMLAPGAWVGQGRWMLGGGVPAALISLGGPL